MTVQELRDKKKRLVARYHKVANDKPPNWWRRCDKISWKVFLTEQKINEKGGLTRPKSAL